MKAITAHLFYFHAAEFSSVVKYAVHYWHLRLMALVAFSVHACSAVCSYGPHANSGAQVQFAAGADAEHSRIRGKTCKLLYI